MRVADREQAYERVLGRFLALLCVVGTWSFATAPQSLLREHWDTTLAWVMVIACSGVAAEAFWNLRDHRRTVGTALTWAVVVLWALVLTAREPFSVPGVSYLALVMLTLALYPLRTVESP